MYFQNQRKFSEKNSTVILWQVNSSQLWSHICFCIQFVVICHSGRRIWRNICFHTGMTWGTSKRVLGPLLRTASLEDGSYICPFHSLLKVTAQTFSLPSFPQSGNRNKEKARKSYSGQHVTDSVKIFFFFWSFIPSCPIITGSF